MNAESFRPLRVRRTLVGMATNTRTQHSTESLDRTLHPLRPGTRRPVRDPHRGAGGPLAGERTTPAGNPPSSARPPLREPDAARAPRLVGRPFVAPTTVPDTSGDLLGLPDLSALRGALRHLWRWLAGQVGAAAELDARVRARRDEDSAAMLRAGVTPTPFA
ncbi:hypothetical protein GCM10009849_01690 [Sinomonas flava]|uniref:Uncharacterized protein n=2 Tax=Sinomonas flava TaxID=496857 RepID=A0ABP5NA87_9MICC